MYHLRDWWCPLCLATSVHYVVKPHTVSRSSFTHLALLASIPQACLTGQHVGTTLLRGSAGRLLSGAALPRRAHGQSGVARVIGTACLGDGGESRGWRVGLLCGRSRACACMLSWRDHGSRIGECVSYDRNCRGL